MLMSFARRLAGLGHRLEVWVGLSVVLLDQLSKAIVRATISTHDSVTVIPGLLNLTHVLNSGAAFGFLNASDFPFKTVVIAMLAVCALIAIGVYAVSFGTETLLTRYALTLILAGACGNLIDRARTGAVVDFVDVYWQTWHFWAFNVADSAITIGAVLLIYDMLRAGRHVPTTV
jgi:signal peptidase II